MILCIEFNDFMYRIILFEKIPLYIVLKIWNMYHKT